MKISFFNKVSLLLMTLFMPITLPGSPYLSIELNQAETFFEDHEIYLHEYALIYLGSLYPYSAYPIAEINSVKARLHQAEGDIGRLFTPYFGESVGLEVTAHFKEYDRFAMEVSSALKSNNLPHAQAIINHWLAYADRMANLFQRINPSISCEILAVLFFEKITFDSQQIMNYYTQNYTAAIRDFDQAREISRQLADYIFGGYP